MTTELSRGDEATPGAARRRGARRLPTHRRLSSALATVCSVAVLAAAVGVTAAPAQAKASKNVLLKDPLSQPSKAVQATSSGGLVTSFVGGKYMFANPATSTTVLGFNPIFDATGAQLSRTSVGIDMSLATKASRAGLNCRQGDTLDTRYVFLVDGGGNWLVGKSFNNTNNVLKRGSIKMGPNQTVHLQMDCSGPETPGPKAAVTGNFFLNGKKVSAITDSASALPVKLPSSIGMEAEPRTTASFSNIVVAQL